MDGKGCQTKLGLSGVAHLNKSIFLLVEEDFHSLNVAVNPWKDIRSQQLKADWNPFRVTDSYDSPRQTQTYANTNFTAGSRYYGIDINSIFQVFNSFCC